MGCLKLTYQPVMQVLRTRKSVQSREAKVVQMWLSIDPLAENSRRWTPYNYAYNNPIFFIDPDGMQATKFDDLDDVIKFMNNGSIERISTNDDFDILTNQSGDMNLKIEHKNGKSQIGEIQEIQLNNNKIQYMFIKDNDVARDVFEFAAQTTANPTSNAEFGLDMFDFSDGFSMNTVQTGEISAKGLANVTPLGQIGNIDLGGNHFIQDANWIENNHSHPGFSRYGQEELGQPIEIDDLTYAYTGNQLQSVTDATNNAEGFNDGNTAGNDYVYDSFGNITQDKNKKITNAKYNHQNLPTEVVFNTGKINYTYDAAGTRLKKQVVPTSAATQTTDYINGFQYVDNVLKFFPHLEGYVEFKNNQYLYTYQYKDHLGNIRLTYRDGYRNHPTLEYAKDGVIQVTEIIEENNYYPFGLKHKGYNELADYSVTNKYKYAYGGKELNDELGLDLYDFGARNYDPAIGRWLNIDPLAENSRRWTPYNYAYNNPIYFVDPDGMQAAKFNELDDIIITGNMAKEAVSELQKSAGSDITLSLNGNNLEYTRNIEGPLTENAQSLVNAIDDHSVIANIDASNNDYASNGDPLLGNQMGATFNENGTATGYQEINPGALGRMDAINNKPGQTTLHETMEAYEVGNISKNTSQNIAPATWADGLNSNSPYRRSHDNVIQQSGNVGHFDQNGNSMPNPSNKVEWNKVKHNIKTIIFGTKPLNTDSSIKMKEFHRINL